MSAHPFRIRPFSLPWDLMEARKLFTRYARDRWFVYLLGGFGVIVTNITEVARPKFIQWAIDFISFRRTPSFAEASTPEESFSILFLCFLILLFVQFCARRLWRLTLGQETHKAGASMKAALWDRARFFPRDRLETDLSTGALMNAATSDVGTARLIFGWTLMGVTDFIFLSALSIFGMLSISGELTACLLVPFVILPYWTFQISQREYRQHGIAQEALSSFNELTSQAVATIKLQRLTQTGRFWVRRLTSAAETYRGERLKAVLISLRFVILMAIPIVLCYGVLFAVGIPKVLSGTLSIGEFVALQSYILLLQGPLGEVGFIVSEWQRGMASLERVASLYKVPAAEGFTVRDEPSRNSAEAALSADVVYSVRNLTFRYPGGSRQVLDGISFDLRKGERLGITGPVGSGKSTLLSILSGHVTAFDGSVCLYDRDIRAWPSQELRSRIAIVDQKPFLFADSVRANIAMNRDFTDEELWEILSIACLADEVRAFPQQLETQLGEWGINLSGGQKQRLTLARAIAGLPPIVLLDDCLSAVDTLTEELILKNLNQFLGDSTLVWTAHRESTLRYCTKHLRMRSEEASV